MPHIIICRGLPASGKSSWALEKVRRDGNWLRFNNDEMRLMLHGKRWKRSVDRFVNRLRDDFIAAAIGSGKNVIIDNTNLNPVHIERIREKFSGRAEIEVKDFDTDVEECIKRDAKRGELSVGERVIRDMYDRYLRPEPVEQDLSLPPAIIVDIDGTIASTGGNRGPYEFEKVGGDLVITGVAALLRIIATEANPIEIILLSGRDSQCRDQTEHWLNQHNIPFDQLIMRAEEDQRRDSIIKRELYEEHIKGAYYVHMVIDDRDQVIRETWIPEGLHVFQSFAPGEPTSKKF